MKVECKRIFAFYIENKNINQRKTKYVNARNEVRILKERRVLVVIRYIVIFLTVFNIVLYNGKSITSAKESGNLILLVDLVEERLYLIDQEQNTILKSYSIASGKSSTPSPIGTWTVVSLGKWGKGFGTRWIGLDVPWGRYGIHGTNRPHTIGSEASHGCIRMFNSDIEELFEYVKHGMTVTIYGGPYGPFEKGLKTLKPGDRGAAVYEVQRRMKDRGYYPGYIDGIYGEGMKKYVIKFRKDNNLNPSHDVDFEFYNKLDIKLID